MPKPPAEGPASTKADAAADARYGLGAGDGMMPVEVTPEGIRAQIKAYRKAWSDREALLRKEGGVTSNLQFLGILTAGYAALSSNVRLGKTGMGVAGLSSLYSSHYEIEVQATNYRIAADAMQCMFSKVTAVPDSFWDATYRKNGEVRPSTEDFDEMLDDDAKAALASLPSLNATIHGRIQEIAHRLSEAQRKVQLATPTVADVTKAVSAEVAATAKAEKVGKKLTDGLQTMAFMNLAPTADAESKERTSAFARLPVETIQRALKLPAETSTCVVLIGG
ncbi:MAG: hypothetical protein ABI781_11950 [Burkholderiales bacterium]